MQAELVAALAILTTWLVVLTVVLTVVLWRRERRACEPVYRRMPDGRIRFEWSVHTACAAHRAAQEPGAPPPHR